jgi:hypothetical protein
MRKLPEVREARELMNEALDWSVFKWMFEKPRVRKTADIANDALDHLERSVKAQWCDQLKSAYAELTPKYSRRNQKNHQAPQPVTPEVKLLAGKIKEADDAAHMARMAAESTFDEAERLLSVGLAQEGCEKAIHAWELQEKAIRKAEAAMETVKSEV